MVTNVLPPLFMVHSVCACLYASEFPRLAAVVHYRSPRQLAKYSLLVHEVQLLMLQRQMMLDVGQQAVSLLQQMDPSDRSVCEYTHCGFAA